MVVPGRALTAAPGTTLFDEATCGWRLEIWQHVYTHRRGVATRVSPLQLPVPGSTSGTNAVRREAASRAVWGSTPATEGRMGKREGTRARAGPGTKRDPSQHEHVGGHRSPHCCICVCSVRRAVFCGCLRRCTGSAQRVISQRLDGGGCRHRLAREGQLPREELTRGGYVNADGVGEVRQGVHVSLP